MAYTTVTDTTTRTTFGQNSLFTALAVGAVVGACGWLIALAVQHFFIGNVFCRSADSYAVCANAGTIGWAVAHGIVALVSLFALVRAAVYRPLLVVLAAFIALWGIHAWLAPMVWWQATLWQAVLFGIAYALFAWLASAERFVYALVATIVVVVIVRVVAVL